MEFWKVQHGGFLATDIGENDVVWYSVFELWSVKCVYLQQLQGGVVWS